jgi:hypothetical protein
VVTTFGVVATGGLIFSASFLVTFLLNMATA